MTGTGGLAAGAALASLLAIGLGTGAMAQDECSADNWQACKGKPWVDGEVMDTPLGSKWWPNEQWGADDEAGSTNYYTQPEVLQRALAANEGQKVYKLGHPYTGDMPLFGARKFAMHMPGLPAGGPFGSLNLVYNDEYVATEIGQVGTQFDGLGHIGIATQGGGDAGEMRWYNGHQLANSDNVYGLKHLGVERLNPIVARGILIDIAAIWDGDMKVGDEVTMEHVKKALEAQGMADFKFEPGDAVLFRYGWEQHWAHPDTFNSGEPGIGMEVARWVAENKIGVTGHDAWAGEAVPNPDPGCAFCVHAYLQTRNGIVNQENLVLSELANDKAYVFTYIYTPVPIAGATGSPGSPIAIR